MGLAGAPPSGVSVPGLAVGTWVLVQTRGNRRSPAVEVRARLGTSARGMSPATDWFFGAIRKRQGRFTLGMNIPTIVVLTGEAHSGVRVLRVGNDIVRVGE